MILSLDQIRTANESNLDARDQASATLMAERRASHLAERLALIAGVPPESVFIDRSAKRAFVRAAELTGADLSAYRALEMRVAADASSWTVTLIPPAAPLPDIAVKDGKIDQEAVDTAIWAARRLHLPIKVSGRGKPATDAVQAFEDAGISVTLARGRPGPVKLTWMAPEETARAAKAAEAD